MDVAAVSSNADQLVELFRRISAGQSDLTNNLLQVAAQNTIDVNKLENIGNVVDLFA